MHAECNFEVMTYIPKCKYTYLQDMHVKRVKYKPVYGIGLEIPLKDTSLIVSAEVSFSVQVKAQNGSSYTQFLFCMANQNLSLYWKRYKRGIKQNLSTLVHVNT